MDGGLPAGKPARGRPGRGPSADSFLVGEVTSDCLLGGLTGVWVLGAGLEVEKNKWVKVLVGVLLRTWTLWE